MAEYGLKDAFVNGFNWLFDGTGGKTPNIFPLIGTGGALWGAIKKNNMANKQYEIQKEAFDFNKTLEDYKKKKQQKIEDNLYAGFNNSTYNQ